MTKIFCPGPLLALLLLTSSPGCGNFQFQEARLPDGKYDLKNLLAALDAKEGEPFLFQMGWIPLVTYQGALFSRGAPVNDKDGAAGGKAVSVPGPYPEGYRFARSRAFGPFFAYASYQESHHAPGGEGYEVREMRRIILRLWEGERTWVRTAHGVRLEHRQTLLLGLLPVYRSIEYLPEAALETADPLAAGSASHPPLEK
ncbi:MAG: hypothetical protein HY717_10190 [Planctomycetes bacterium]|nr:hypothetical protein [Planctomycetota bacterium]